MIDLLSLNSLVVITLFCWGAWGIFDKLALKHGNTTAVMAALYVFSIPILFVSVIYLYLTHPGWHPDSRVLFWTFLAASSYLVAMVFYLKAMLESEASFVLGVTSSYPVVLQILSTLCLGEPLVAARIGGGVLIAIGVVAMSSRPSGSVPTLRTADGAPAAVAALEAGAPGSMAASAINPGHSLNLRVIACTAVATILWGIWGIFDKVAVDISTPADVFAGKCFWDVVYFLIGVAYIFATGKQLKIDRRVWLPTALSAATLNVGAVTYLMAMTMATASYVIAITGCYPLFMYLLALIILKEQFNSRRLIGIILVTMGGLITHTTQGL